jgi:fructose-bisphosphate aldolase class II
MTNTPNSTPDASAISAIPLDDITNFRSCIEWAKKNRVAIGHFNISNLETLHAIASAAKKLNVPVIIGVSEGERDAIGVAMSRAMVTSIAYELNHPIFLNADHTYSFERVKEAIDAGYDSVIIDAAKLSKEENIALTKKSVDYAKQVNELSGQDILVEGELGYIGSGSVVMDKIPEGVGLDPALLTHPDEVAGFVAVTGIDLIAPAVGNVHGLVRGGNPKLNIGRIAEITAASPAGVVLHGASGIGLDELEAAVAAGVRIVHYNTELRVAFANALAKFVKENPEETTPYKLTKTAREAVAKVVEEKLRIMNKMV